MSGYPYIFVSVVTDVALRFVLDTHLHNDYVSGAEEAAATTGAQLVLPAAAAPAYPSTPAFHLEDIPGGALTIRPIHTPGHTPEHTSYLVLVDGEPAALFSGGSLLVASAGRPDLLGPERARTMATPQHQSLHRLAELTESLELFPTHGQGSFCTASGAGASPPRSGRSAGRTRCSRSRRSSSSSTSCSGRRCRSPRSTASWAGRSRATPRSCSPPVRTRTSSSRSPSSPRSAWTPSSGSSATCPPTGEHRGRGAGRRRLPGRGARRGRRARRRGHRRRGLTAPGDAPDNRHLSMNVRTIHR